MRSLLAAAETAACYQHKINHQRTTQNTHVRVHKLLSNDTTKYRKERRVTQGVRSFSSFHFLRSLDDGKKGAKLGHSTFRKALSLGHIFPETPRYSVCFIGNLNLPVHEPKPMSEQRLDPRSLEANAPYGIPFHSGDGITDIPSDEILIWFS